MAAPSPGAYLSVAEVMRELTERSNPPAGQGRPGAPRCRKALLRAGMSVTSYKRLMRDPTYWRRMDVETLDRLLRSLGFDLMVCVGPASILRSPAHG